MEVTQLFTAPASDVQLLDCLQDSAVVPHSMPGFPANVGEAITCRRCQELKVPEALLNCEKPRDVQTLSNLAVQRSICDVISIESRRCIHCLKLRKVLRLGVRASCLRRSGEDAAEWEAIRLRSTFTLSEGGLERHSNFDEPGGFITSYLRSPFTGTWYFIHEIFNSRALPVAPLPNYVAIAKWLQHCSEAHTKCADRASESLNNISLIHVFSRRVVSYQSIDQASSNYLAVSYVWGGVQPLQQWPGHLPEVLPRVIEDSMTVTRALGQRYLWVDSVCINQSDPVTKMDQIRIMDKIYEGAFATIIALDATSADDGLPGVSSDFPRRPQMTVNFGQHRLLDCLPSLQTKVTKSCWASRAWTFQEGMLSRRRLIFTQDQVYFVCNEMHCSEVYDTAATFNCKRRRDSYRPPADLQHPLMCLDQEIETDHDRCMFFSRLLRSYTERTLSDDSDSLNACSALLGYMGRWLFPDGFLYGLPKANLRSSLLWSQCCSFSSNPIYTDSSPRLHNTINATTRRNTPNIPSWSWAAWKIQATVLLADLSHKFPLFDETIQAPLSVNALIGESFLDSAYVEEESNSTGPDPILSLMEDDFSVIIQCLCNTIAFYERIRTKGYSNINAQLGFEFRPFHLLVEGIVLRLPCYVELYRGGQQCWEGRRPLIPYISFPDGCSCKMVWANDGYIENIAPVLSRSGHDTVHDVASVPHGISTDEGESVLLSSEIQENTFLLTSVSISEINETVTGYELDVRLIHLYWQSSIAYRGGVVQLRMPLIDAKRFWQFCDGAQYCRFHFG